MKPTVCVTDPNISVRSSRESPLHRWTKCRARMLFLLFPDNTLHPIPQTVRTEYGRFQSSFLMCARSKDSDLRKNAVRICLRYDQKTQSLKCICGNCFLHRAIVIGLQTSLFRGILIFFCANIILRFLSMVASGIVTQAANTHIHQRVAWNSGRKSLMIMSDGIVQ